MIEELKIYRDVSELIKRVFIIVKNFPRDYTLLHKWSQ
jgi:hypothetical protein